MTGFGFSVCGTMPQTLRVGTNIWPGYEPLYLAKSLGYLHDTGVELVHLPSATEVIRAYRNRVIDVAALTLDEVLLASENLATQHIILVCDFSQGADAVIATPPIRSMQSLRGKRIGVEQNALGAFMLSRALETAGMKPTDVKVIPIPLQEHLESIQTKAVDAVVTFDPMRSKILAAGGTVLFDSSQIPGEIVDVLLASPETIQLKSRAIEVLIQAWFRAIDYQKKDPLDAAKRVAPREQITPEAFLTSLKGLEFPDQLKNLQLLGDSSSNLQVTLTKLRGLMVQHHLLSPLPGASIKLESQFVRGATP